jgi:hypothetical protein
MAAITRVYTIGHVAEMIGEDEDWLEGIAIDMEPEDGRLIVWGIGEDGITAFTDFGVENLQQISKICAPSEKLPPLNPRPS